MWCPWAGRGMALRLRSVWALVPVAFLATGCLGHLSWEPPALSPSQPRSTDRPPAGCNRRQRAALTKELHQLWGKPCTQPCIQLGVWRPAAVVWRRRRGRLITRNPRWKGWPLRGIRVGEAAHPGPPAPGMPVGGERQRERSPPRGAASMHVDTRVYCPVPGCPCSDPLRARGWRSVFSMQSHIDAHLAGTLAGHVPTTWMQQQQRQRCGVCGLSVSTRYGIHPTCRPEARASAAGRAEAHGANDRLPSLLAIQGGATPTLRRVPAAARHSWGKALTRALSAVQHNNTEAAWQELLMLPQTVLDALPREARSTRRRWLLTRWTGCSDGTKERGWLFGAVATPHRHHDEGDVLPSNDERWRSPLHEKAGTARHVRPCCRKACVQKRLPLLTPSKPSTRRNLCRTNLTCSTSLPVRK